MEHVELTTENIIDENVEKLAELFPEVVTEVREPDGSLRHTIDVDALRECVGDVAEGQRERYQFTWPGKREAKQEAYRQINKCLRPCPEESVNWDTTQNLYIEGDNLDALKLLRNTYAGKVKMIYIDPPYNTGHDFIYDDDFARTKADYDAESGDYDEEGGRLVANPESNGRFHSDWCSMMYPRLLLARDLLSEDGVIFISIDDYEQHNLKRLCDEVFGSSNFVAELVTVMNLKGNNDQFGFSGTHEYTLVYIKNALSVDDLNGISLSAEDIASYEFEDESGKYKIGATLMRTGEAGSREKRPKGFYPIFVASDYGSFDTIRHSESDIEVYPRTKDGVDMSWRRSPDNLHETRNEFVIKRGANGVSFYKKQRLDDDLVRGKKPKSLFYKAEYSSGNGTAAMKALFGGRVFDNPKPIVLIEDFIKVGSSPASVILDFFSGSATTAHAVMQLNAEDDGNRKFIMVQLPEACDERSEAAKAGYENICEIGKERIRRAGRKIAAEVEEQNRQPKLGEEPKKVPDIGFRVLKIDSSNFEDVSAEPAEYTQQTLAGLADNLKPGRTAEDLLFQVMPQFQIPLSAKIEKRNVNGSTVFSVDDGRLVACFDRNVATETIVAMAKSQPDYAVMRDASFTGDDAVSNFGELFKTYSSATITRVV